MKRISMVALFGALLAAFMVASLLTGLPLAAIPFEYDKGHFTEIRVRQEEKIDSSDKAVQDQWPIDAPSHTCYDLESDHPLPALEKGGRYFFPARSFVCIVPAIDASTECAAAYPNFSQAVDKLGRLLSNKPAEFTQFEDLFDFPYNNAGWSLKAKVDYLNYKNLSGVFFLTQYSQDIAPSPLNNEELTANFQGLTNDGKYYVAARFAITHTSLPRGIDFTGNIQDAAQEAKSVEELTSRVREYLEEEERKLEKLDDASFSPSIQSLKKIIESISPD